MLLAIGGITGGVVRAWFGAGDPHDAGGTTLGMVPLVVIGLSLGVSRLSGTLVPVVFCISLGALGEMYAARTLWTGLWDVGETLMSRDARKTTGPGERIPGTRGVPRPGAATAVGPDRLASAGINVWILAGPAVTGRLTGAGLSTLCSRPWQPPSLADLSADKERPWLLASAAGRRTTCRVFRVDCWRVTGAGAHEGNTSKW
mmetsp:Transcript_52884/g.116071  ORF Transcript_52884/g.116071 Transcript_52884/m.116071 type:complete len:202 (-) Transcript_52884:697-1302(-)